MRVLAALMAFGISWAMAPPAHALNCLPLVGCSCAVSASDIEFDDVNPLLPGAHTAIGAIDITCGGVLSLGGGVTVEILQGQWGTYAMRKMRSPAGDMINYNIYTSGAHTQVWGAGAQAVVINTGVALLQTWTIHRDMHARMIADPAMKPGGYADTVVVRVIW